MDEASLHLVSRKDWDGAPGWVVTSDVARDVFAGEVGDWSHGR